MNEPCDLCAGTSFRAYAAGIYRLGASPYDLLRCRQCSLVQVRPLPEPGAIATMYGDDYFDKDYDSCLCEQSYFDSFPRLMERYSLLLDAVESLAKERGSLFEVGCAGGYFLKLAGERGWKVSGVEITQAGSEHAAGELGLDVTRGSFPDPSLPPRPVDVLYMGHVLEHLRSPSEGIEATRSWLRPGGLLVVEVPTYIDSFYFRALRRGLPLLRSLGLAAGGVLRALKFPEPGETMQPFHLYEFRRRTLEDLLARHGYRVLRSQSRVPKPEALARGGVVARILGSAFDLLDAAARHLGLPGGNISVFARREAP